MTIESYTVLLLGFGAIVLLVAWLPLLLAKLPLSGPIVCLAVGWGAGYLGILPFSPAPVQTPLVSARITEATMIIALMGAGLNIDRPFNLKTWGTTWRLLGVGMPLALAAMTLASHALGFSWPTALLIAGALTPTDPVLASDVEVGPPRRGEEGETRFGLTSEAGLNDGLALPFVSLAIALNAGHPVGALWVAQHFIWAIGLAVGLGWVLGRYLFGWLTFKLPRVGLSRTGDGLVALGMTFVTYGLTQLIGLDGFIAVFAAAIGLRSARPDDEFHNAMSDFMRQIQRLLMMLVLVLLGIAVAFGLLSQLTWRAVLLGLGLLFVIRPACAWASLIGSRHPRLSQALMAFFGIRGVGSLYYLAFALVNARWTEAQELGAIVTFVVVASIVVHGLTVTPLMRWADRERRKMLRERSDAN
jgi:NhaP-type Na+/H+ or K+/H+ antiporter